MTPFALDEPTSFGAAIGLLSAEDPTVRPISGGTALMLMMKAGVFRASRLVSLHRVEARYSAIGAGADGTVRIGALATLTTLEHDAAVRHAHPVIAQCLHTLANVRIRNVATVGGCLAHADPHMDLPPVLIALGATAIVNGAQGECDVAIEDLYSGYFQTTLARNELISGIVIPPQPARRAAYTKISTRSAHDWPALGIAASLDFDGSIIRDARIVVSAATEKAARVAAAEQALRGQVLDVASMRTAGEAAADTLELIADARGSAAYKKQLVRVHVARTLAKLMGQR